MYIHYIKRSLSIIHSVQNMSFDETFDLTAAVVYFKRL